MLALRMLFCFKAELEKTNPGSIVDIEFEKDGEGKHRFTRMFVALHACVDGFLYGCRPYLGVGHKMAEDGVSTHLSSS
jgi:hypothetical protein